jgi:hypothetical protein
MWKVKRSTMSWQKATPRTELPKGSRRISSSSATMPLNSAKSIGPSPCWLKRAIVVASRRSLKSMPLAVIRSLMRHSEVLPFRGAAILRHPIKELLQTIHWPQLLAPSH